MSAFESLSHSRWDCKYHVVFVPKCRKKALYGKIRKFYGFYPALQAKGEDIVTPFNEVPLTEGGQLSAHWLGQAG